MSNYYWEDRTPKILIIEVNGRRWNYGSLVLDSLKSFLKRESDMTIDEFFELEKEHFSNLEMRDLQEEFEVIKQTVEYHEIIFNYYKNTKQ